MMGERRVVDQGALFYEFSLERHVPAEHLLRAIDRFVELEGVRAHLAYCWRAALTGPVRFAVVPWADETSRLAGGMAVCCTAAGVEIALVHWDDSVEFVGKS
jgi:hypothetical protein